MSCKNCNPQSFLLNNQTVAELIVEQLAMERELASKEIAQRRTLICEECCFRSTHTCTACGCFYQFRASLKNKYCPKGYWS
ncbi:DUF6171 family protein [Enterococcus sp. LJL128]|uniref:DUF6171 family protein n=1 Tax=Enterococcus sp. LJL51 TaxID=3416656 RepID=UPI003CEAA7E9